MIAHPWPALDAALNGGSAVLLVLGFVFIRRRQVAAHRACMLGAFGVSALFLACYLSYHLVLHRAPTRYSGTGWTRPVYFTILISHTFLATTVLPLALITLHRALRGRFVQHVRIARWTWPVWVYVSVTGVVVYWMLYQPSVPLSMGDRSAGTSLGVRGAPAPCSSPVEQGVDALHRQGPGAPNGLPFRGILDPSIEARRIPPASSRTSAGAGRMPGPASSVPPAWGQTSRSAQGGYLWVRPAAGPWGPGLRVGGVKQTLPVVGISGARCPGLVELSPPAAQAIPGKSPQERRQTNRDDQDPVPPIMALRPGH